MEVWGNMPLSHNFLDNHRTPGPKQNMDRNFASSRNFPVLERRITRKGKKSPQPPPRLQRVRPLSKRDNGSNLCKAPAGKLAPAIIRIRIKIRFRESGTVSGKGLTIRSLMAPISSLWPFGPAWPLVHVCIHDIYICASIHLDDNEY